MLDFNPQFVTGLTWVDILPNITKNGISGDLEFLWFADAEHKWYSRNHYLLVKWWERTYPILLNSLKDYFYSTPFFCVWFLGLFVWFFIELSVNVTESFNLKHVSDFFLTATFTYSSIFAKSTNVSSTNSFFYSTFVI